MRCPFCGNEETQVKDSRASDDQTSIRRRRFCPKCVGRFTTFERVQLRELTVMKNDGVKEAFDRDKITRSIQIALRKRPVSLDQIELLVNSLIRQLETHVEQDVTTKLIGQLVMDALSELDQVGYVRYASVYHDFQNPSDFNRFVQKLKPQEITQLL
ncbi:MAG: transcriptional repressor NrdR [Alphaproteobacteria bacterium]|jgi:transcriptional repressor NrdR|nr:transcriptional repressor NrdR [Alphaproteobacteria bacterium]MBP9876749.1 transcriptional repressor NrdR [Alphaproteobacteria bacterium]